MISFRAVARPWRRRQLPRAPVFREHKFDKYLTKTQKTNINSQQMLSLSC